MPKQNLGKMHRIKGMERVGVETVQEAIDLLFKM